MACPVYTPTSTKLGDINSDLLAIYSGPMAVMTDVANTDSTGHIPVATLQARYATLKTAGIFSNAMAPGQLATGALETQIANDRKLMVSLQEEYCWYYSRYAYALKNWIGYATSRDSSQSALAASTLPTVQTLNMRCIFIVEFMNYVTQLRIPPAQQDAASIATANASLNTKLQSLQQAKSLFDQNNAQVITQREMVRYTAEKNTSMMSSVVMWGAINVIALGAIGAVYTMM